MERFLITQSLLSTWAYMLDCYDDRAEEARDDFLRALRREKSEPTQAMQNGIDFENMVYGLAAGAPEKLYRSDLDVCNWVDGAKQISEIIRGAQVQVKASREITVAGMSFLVYGILDALKAGTIYDVKFSNKSLGSTDIYGKYLNSAQHPAYLYIVPEATDFQYLVSDGTDVYIERYDRRHTRHIGEIISDFIHFIAGMGVLDIYKERWRAA